MDRAGMNDVEFMSPFVSPHSTPTKAARAAARKQVVYTALSPPNSARHVGGDGDAFAAGERRFGQAHHAALVIAADVLACFTPPTTVTTAVLRLHVDAARHGPSRDTGEAAEYVVEVLDVWARAVAGMLTGVPAEDHAVIGFYTNALFAKVIRSPDGFCWSNTCMDAMASVVLCVEGELASSDGSVAARARVFGSALAARWTFDALTPVDTLEHERDAPPCADTLGRVISAARASASWSKRCEVMRAIATFTCVAYDGMPHANGAVPSGMSDVLSNGLAAALDKLSSAFEATQLVDPDFYLRHASSGNTAFARAVRATHRAILSNGTSPDLTDKPSARLARVIFGDPFGFPFAAPTVMSSSVAAHASASFVASDLARRVGRWCACEAEHTGVCGKHPSAMRPDRLAALTRSATDFKGRVTFRWSIVALAAVEQRMMLLGAIYTVRHGQKVVFTALDKRTFVHPFGCMPESLAALAKDLQKSASIAASSSRTTTALYMHAVIGSDRRPNVPLRTKAAVVTMLCWHAAARAALRVAIEAGTVEFVWHEPSSFELLLRPPMNRVRDEPACARALATFAAEGTIEDTRVLGALTCYLAKGRMPFTTGMGDVHTSARFSAAARGFDASVG